MYSDFDVLRKRHSGKVREELSVVSESIQWNAASFQSLARPSRLAPPHNADSAPLPSFQTRTSLISDVPPAPVWHRTPSKIGSILASLTWRVPILLVGRSCAVPAREGRALAVITIPLPLFQPLGHSRPRIQHSGARRDIQRCNTICQTSRTCVDTRSVDIASPKNSSVITIVFSMFTIPFQKFTILSESGTERFQKRY